MINFKGLMQGTGEKFFPIYPGYIRTRIEDDKNKLHVFDKNGSYLATKKIGKNNPKAEQIKEDNEVRMQWNHEADRALVCQVPEDEIRQIKNEFITDRIRNSIKVWGNNPLYFPTSCERQLCDWYF